MATSIKELLDELTEEERRTLNYAFENLLAQYILMPDGRYIGVHLDGHPGLSEPDMRAGMWSSGSCVKVG
jgi:hypothetical protein